MPYTAGETALLIACLIIRARTRRARISEKTIRLLSRRRYLRSAFIGELSRELDYLGLHLVEIERGGFGIIFSSALHGAPAVTAQKYLMDVLKEIKREGERFDFSKLRREVETTIDEGYESDEDE